MFVEKRNYYKGCCYKNLCRPKYCLIECTTEGLKTLSTSLFKFLKDVKIDNFSL